MVVLTFTVTDNRSRYINGLKPGDFRILEDGIAQKIATFSEGSKPAVQVLADGGTRPIVPSEEAASAPPGSPGAADALVGTNVFVLFDTSNYMYRGFVYASDAIADFIRGLDRADSVAVYTFSRNLSRAASLTPDRTEAIMGLRKAVAGDDAALYNAMLLALRDAAKVPGRKVLIVFSNGPDNASMIAPDDVRTVAEDEGIPIYVISTNEVSKDSDLQRGLPAPHQPDGRQGLLRQDLAEAGGGLRIHPRGPGQLLHGDILPGAESERGIPAHFRGDRLRRGEEVPGARQAGLSPAGRRLIAERHPPAPRRPFAVVD